MFLDTGCGCAVSIPWSQGCVTVLDPAPGKLIRDFWDLGCAVGAAGHKNKAAQSYCCCLCKKGPIISSIRPTDTNCGQTQSLPCGCKSVRSPSDGERVGFYILVESSSQHRALSWWLFPSPPHLSRAMRLSRAMLCTSATLQPARGWC